MGNILHARTRIHTNIKQPGLNGYPLIKQPGILSLMDNRIMNTMHTKKSKATKDRKLQTLPHNFPNVLIFILTAKVGGLGKIMGANRVIIFHPHWNPTLDIQMRLSFLMFYITLQNEWVGQLS
ncbi:hypothetical protein CTI12_AA106160 [Artemisia annua]|uniref:Uncharacterized protein n=1 Tax=Artemisia annua TaxID=35608 RepID=A0A2U1NJF8_ARTAN|nr:hypothetical protein CTI12_AA106160 [Artemisia annua]